MLLYVYGNTCFIALLRIESHLPETQDILLLEGRITYNDIASSVPCAFGLPFQGHGCSHTRAQGTEVIRQWVQPLLGYVSCLVQPWRIDPESDDGKIT